MSKTSWDLSSKTKLKDKTGILSNLSINPKICPETPAITNWTIVWVITLCLTKKTWYGLRAPGLWTLCSVLVHTSIWAISKLTNPFSKHISNNRWLKLLEATTMIVTATTSDHYKQRILIMDRHCCIEHKCSKTKILTWGMQIEGQM